MADPLDVIEGAVQLLKADLAVTSLVGGTDGTPWIFQDNVYNIVKGKSAVGLSVETRGNWQAPVPSSSFSFPRLWINAYSDPTRDAEGNIQVQDARRNAMAVLAVVDQLFHKPGMEGWVNTDGSYLSVGGLRVTKSVRFNEPNFSRVPDGDGMVLGSVVFALTVG